MVYTSLQYTRHLSSFFFLWFRPVPQVVTAPAALGWAALVVQREHHRCRSPLGQLAIHTPFLRCFHVCCIFLDTRALLGFGLWLQGLRGESSLSFATPSGSAFASGALWDSVLFNCAPSPKVHFVCRCAAFPVFCTASSLYSSLAVFFAVESAASSYHWDAEITLLAMWKNAFHLASFLEKEKLLFLFLFRHGTASTRTLPTAGSGARHEQRHLAGEACCRPQTRRDP